MAAFMLNWLMTRTPEELLDADAKDRDYVPDAMELDKEDESDYEVDEAEDAEPTGDDAGEVSGGSARILATRIVLLTYGLVSGPRRPRFDPLQLAQPIDGICKETLTVGCLKLSILKNQARQWTQEPSVRPDDYVLYRGGRRLDDCERFYNARGGDDWPIMSPEELARFRQASPGPRIWEPSGPCIYLTLAPAALTLPRYVNSFTIIVHRPFGVGQSKAPMVDVINVNDRTDIWECNLGALRRRYSCDRIWRPIGLCHEIWSDATLPAVFFGLNEGGTIHLSA